MINPFIVINHTEAYFNLPRGSLTSSSKSRNIHYARAIAMKLVKQLCHLNFVEIGNYFNRDHTGVYATLIKLQDIILDEDTHLNTKTKDTLLHIENVKTKINNEIITNINTIWG
jgi:chromosomal replication initiation ATPase DnaA